MENSSVSYTLTSILITVFMLPVDIVIAIFGDDPDTFRFYIGILFVFAYCVLIGILGTIAVVFVILSGFHMLGMILFEWFP